MDRSHKQDQENKRVTKVKTFSIPFAFGELKENITIDLSNISIEEQGESNHSEEELDDMDAILDVAEFASGIGCSLTL